MTGESQEDAIASVKALFDALPKTQKMECLGVFIEALIYIETHPPQASK